MLEKTLVELIKRELTGEPTLINVSRAMVAITENEPSFDLLLQTDGLSVPSYLSEINNPGSRYVGNEDLWSFYESIMNAETYRDKVMKILSCANLGVVCDSFRNAGFVFTVIYGNDSISRDKVSVRRDWDDDVNSFVDNPSNIREISYDEYYNKLMPWILSYLISSSDDYTPIEEVCAVAARHIFTWNFY